MVVRLLENMVILLMVQILLEQVRAVMPDLPEVTPARLAELVALGLVLCLVQVTSGLSFTWVVAAVAATVWPVVMVVVPSRSQPHLLATMVRFAQKAATLPTIIAVVAVVRFISA